MTTPDPFEPVGARDKLLRTLATVDAAEMRRVADAAMMVLIIIDHEFQRRFPTEYAAWAASQEQDRDR